MSWIGQSPAWVGRDPVIESFVHERPSNQVQAAVRVEAGQPHPELSAVVGAAQWVLWGGHHHGTTATSRSYPSPGTVARRRPVVASSLTMWPFWRRA